MGRHDRDEGAPFAGGPLVESSPDARALGALGALP